MRPRVRELAGGLLDSTEKEAASTGGPVDLVASFAAPLAMAVIGELLGIPEPDRPQFHDWVRQFADVSAPAEHSAEGGEKLGAYIADLVAARQQSPGDDVLSALITARGGAAGHEGPADRLTFDELVGLGFTLLGAGFDSSAGQLANFTLALLADHPEAWRRLGECPQEIPAAVEELLRTVNLNGDDTSGLPRIATEDVVIGGVTVPAGDAVFLAFPSGNRDAAVFERPDQVDLRRTRPGHMAFGHGIHRCLGAPLARLELAVAVEELTRRFPGARLAVPEQELCWRLGDVNHNLLALPVHLHPQEHS